jgi:hypothetical protein
VTQVVLTPSELHIAAHVGVLRQIASLRDRRRDRHGYNGDGWSEHIQGAAGEQAVAKALGVFWDGSVDTFRTVADVAGVEVRTRSRHDYELLHRPDDDPTKAYVLVTGRAPYLWVRGWMRGENCRRDEWWAEHGGRPGAWFVPTDELHPIAELEDR